MFTFNDERTQSDYPQQVLEGEYQLEIRRSSEFGTQNDDNLPGVPLDWVHHVRTFDTNDRLVRETAVVSHELARNSLATDAVTDTDTVSAEGDLTVASVGLATPGRLLQGSGDSDSATEHSVLKWEVDLREQPSAYLEFAYRVNQSWFNPSQSSEILTPLPPTFEITAEDDLPMGDGVAISMDGGVTWKRIANFTTTANGFVGQTNHEQTLQVNLADAIDMFDPDFAAFGRQTVIGFFRSGPNQGGIEVGNAVIRTSPLIATSGRVGDKNNEFENQQGQFIVQNTIVTDSLEYGIRIDAGRVGDGSQSPDFGVAQNRAVTNTAGLVPGAVVTNTIVANAGVAGIYFGGTASTTTDANSVRPFGRLVNNTIYGGGSGIGIEVANNAAPTILNNVFSELDTGVKVDSTSRFDNANGIGTEIGTSAFYLVGTEVDGTSQSLGLTLTEDPFVNKERNNFYPAANSRIIDSSRNVLEDRPAMVVVRDAIGISESPILAPEKDIYGLTRDDEPDVASIPGLGLNAFKDRGAVERLDITQPEAALTAPLDQSQVSPIDLDNRLHTVELEGQEARQQEKFILQLTDIGTGIDTVSVTENENTSLTVTGVYAKVSGDVSDVTTLILDTDEFGGLLENASVAIDNVDTGATVTEIVGNQLTLSGPVSAVNGAYVSFGFGDSASVDTNRVIVSSSNSVDEGLLINGISGVVGANAIAAVDSTMNAIELEKVATVASNDELTLTAFLLQRDGQVLEAGDDYFFQYNTNTNQVVFAAASTFTLGDYELRVAPTVQDLAGNSLLTNNTVNKTTEFSIILLDVPSAPPAPTVTQNADREVELVWSEPSTSASAPVTDYIVETSIDGQDWREFSDSVSDSLSATVTNHGSDILQNGTPYSFRVRAVNRVGQGEPSPLSAAFTPLDLPSNPQNLSVTAGFKQLDISWNSPNEDGDNDPDGDGAFDDPDNDDRILHYVVEYSTDEVTWQPHSSNSIASPLTIDNLAGGLSYHVRVAAVNARGQGSFETTDPLSPANPTSEPGVVQNLSFSATGNGEVTLNWTQPLFDGGSSISDYVIETNIDDGQGWLEFVDGVSVGTTQAIETHDGLALAIGSTLQARVSAKNADGHTGDPVELTGIIIGGLPGSVTGAEVALGDEQVTLSWTAPVFTGHYPITGYIVERYNTVTEAWDNETTTTSTSVTISGLTNGEEYRFRVVAETDVGRSASPVEFDPATPQDMPDAPTNLTAIPGDNEIVLTWSAPADNGGQPITDYDIQYRAEGGNWTDYNATEVSASTTATIPSLVNLTEYEVRVRAVNIVGFGEWSSIETAIPVGPPEAPTGIEFVVDGESGTLAYLRWVSSEPNSEQNVTYEVKYRTSSNESWNDIAGDTIDLPTLTTDKAIDLSGMEISTAIGYEFQLQASTSLGDSDAVTVEPFENLVISPSDSKISLDWYSFPNTVSDYSVQYRHAGASAWLPVPFEPISNASDTEITQLINGQAYDIRITSVPATGAQPVSMVITSVEPAGLPQMISQPRWTNILLGSGSAAIAWDAAVSNGTPILEYVIEYTLDEVTFTQIGDEGFPPTPTSASLSGLPTGIELAVRIKAVNRIGTSLPSPLSLPVILPGAPTQPTNLSAEESSSGIALTWAAPSTSGGLPMSGYFIEYSTDGTAWSSWLPNGGVISTTATSATVTGLERDANNPYVFRVTAKNSGYSSLPSASSNQVVPFAAPDAITLNATPSDQAMQLSWEFPDDHDNGGLSVTGYQVEGRVTDSDTWLLISNVGATSRQLTVSFLNATRLQNNESYDFRVAAVNGVTPLNYQTVTQSPMGTAAAPTNLQASSGSSSVTLSWEAPTDNGGGVITDYEIEYRVQNEGNPGAWISASDVSLSSTSSRVSGLTLGTRYEFQVAAVNGAGTGAFSSIESVVVGPVPAAPPAVFAWKQSGQVHLLWDSVTMPAGVSLEYYQVEYRRVGTDSWTTLGTDTDIRATFPGLPSGTYQFRVAAVANTGIGAYRISNQTVSF